MPQSCTGEGDVLREVLHPDGPARGGSPHARSVVEPVLEVREAARRLAAARDRGLGTVYSTEAGAFDEGTERALTRFSVPAAALLSHVQTTETPQQIRSELSAALQTRDRIGMAKGILMAQLGIDDRSAFRELVARAQDGRRSVADVALELTGGAGAPNA